MSFLRLIRDSARNNVVALFALLVAVGGTAYAAATVGSPQVIDNSLRGVDIRDESVGQADLRPAMGWHEVGAPGEVPFSAEPPARWWANETLGGTHETAGFYRDPYGVVHLKGSVCARFGDPQGPCEVSLIGAGTSRILRLPLGFRPAKELSFSVWGGANDDRPDDGPSLVAVRPSGAVLTDETLETWLSLDNVSFRCSPSGTGGCP